MASSSNTPTIIDLKTTFLRSQILLLSQPLRPSSTFNSSTPEENALRQKSIDDALQKLNVHLKKHSKLAYGPQAQRHVAEQVDRWYWKAGERGVSAGGEDWAARGADHRQSEIIEQLPETWSEEASAQAPEAAAKFTALQKSLSDLNERRHEVRQRLETHRRMKEMLEPFYESGRVQENLVTRNGEIEKEMERMRMLMLRVERGVSNLEQRNQRDSEGDSKLNEMEDWEEASQKNLESILAGRGQH